MKVFLNVVSVDTIIIKKNPQSRDCVQYTPIFYMDTKTANTILKMGDGKSVIGMVVNHTIPEKLRII